MPDSGTPTQTTKTKGDRGEELAALHLLAQGYHIVERKILYTSYHTEGREAEILPEAFHRPTKTITLDSL